MVDIKPISLAELAVSRTEAQSARRQRFTKEALAELAASIKQHGVLQPIIVRVRINDCIYAPEIRVATWSDAKPTKLLAAAKAAGVDAAAVRRSVAPAKKKAKKKAGKKAGKKKGSKKKTARAKKKTSKRAAAARGR